MELNPAKIKFVVPTKLDDDHIIEFSTDRNVNQRQAAMYNIKNACTQLGLRNGTDYLFLNLSDDHTVIRMWFQDVAMASQIAWQRYVNE